MLVNASVGACLERCGVRVVYCTGEGEGRARVPRYAANASSHIHGDPRWEAAIRRLCEDDERAAAYVAMVALGADYKELRAALLEGL